jgi:tRNA-2-methylthio-N6-dimethylallyladenosine synthase
VLLERPGKKPGQMIGKSPWLQSVVVETAEPAGTMLDATITHAGPVSLNGIAA